MSEGNHDGVLTVVRVVCHDQSLEPLLHVLHLIQDFLAPDLTLETAVKMGSFRLFTLTLHILETSSRWNHYEKLQQYRRSMHLLCAFDRQGLPKYLMEQQVFEAMQQLCERYPGSLDTPTVYSIIGMGKLPSLQLLYTYNQEAVSKNVGRIFAYASTNGHEVVVRWLQQLFPHYTYSLREAARGGHLNLIKWLIAHARWDQSSIGYAVEAAAAKSDLEMVKYFHDQAASPYTVSVFHLRDLAIVEWADEKGVVKHWSGLPYYCASDGHLDILRWLHATQKPGFSPNVMDQAAQGGHLEVVQWLHANRSEGCTTRAMDDAAQNGHLEVVQWLHENRQEGCTTAAMDWAAYHGQMGILEWLHVNRQEGVSPRVADLVVQGNRFDILKWLYAHYGVRGYIDLAVGTTDNLEMIKWLHFHGEGVCSKGAMDNAAWGGRFDIMKFLHQHRSEGCTREAFRYAAENNYVDMMKWLIAHYPKYYVQTTVAHAARNGNVEMVKCLLQLRKRWEISDGMAGAMVAAAEKGHFQVMKLLHAEFPKRWPRRVMKAALTSRDMGIVRWLYFHTGTPLYEGCEVDAAQADNVGALEFIRTHWDFHPDPSIYFSAQCEGNLEVELWYVDHFGNPNKHRRQ